MAAAKATINDPKKYTACRRQEAASSPRHVKQAARIYRPKLLSTQLPFYLLTHPAPAGLQDVGGFYAMLRPAHTPAVARTARSRVPMPRVLTRARSYDQARGLAAGAASAALVSSAGGLGCVRLRHTYTKCRSRPVDSWLSSVRCATSHGWKGPWTCGRPQPVSPCTCDCPALAAVPDSSTSSNKA